MKIFDWVQGKFNGKQNTTKKLNSIFTTNDNAQELHKEEFKDWPHGLLAIGTFGNTNDTIQLTHSPLNPPPPQDLNLPQDDEEMEKLHHEFLTSLYDKHDDHPILDEFYDFLPRSDGEDDSHYRDTDVVVSRGSREGCLDNTKSVKITKRSFSFLLKKMFFCRSGFVTSSYLRDQLPESRIERILKALLHKKILCPHTISTPTFPSKKRYLANRRFNQSESDEDKVKEKMGDGCKWVKTDSEYIVLEI